MTTYGSGMTMGRVTATQKEEGIMAAATEGRQKLKVTMRPL